MTFLEFFASFSQMRHLANAPLSLMYHLDKTRHYMQAGRFLILFRNEFCRSDAFGQATHSAEWRKLLSGQVTHFQGWKGLALLAKWCVQVTLV